MISFQILRIGGVVESSSHKRSMSQFSTNELPEFDEELARIADDHLRAKFEFLELLGKGGMGTVFKARSSKDGRIVALKFIDKTHSQTDLERLHREKQVSDLMNDKHIVEVLDLSVSNSGFPYLVMEFADGISLEQLLKQTGAYNALAISLFKQSLQIKSLTDSERNACKLGIKELEASAAMMNRHYER